MAKSRQKKHPGHEYWAPIYSQHENMDLNIWLFFFNLYSLIIQAYYIYWSCFYQNTDIRKKKMEKNPFGSRKVFYFFKNFIYLFICIFVAKSWKRKSMGGGGGGGGGV